MRRIFIYLLTVALIVGLIFFAISGIDGAISALVAYISASLITISSMSSYKKMVEARLEAGIIPQEDRDELDKIEDPHRLYEDEEIDKRDISNILKEEREKLKLSRRGFKESIKDSTPALSPIKLISYAILALGFIWLKSSGIMVLYAYLISLAIPMVVIVYLLINQER